MNVLDDFVPHIEAALLNGQPDGFRALLADDVLWGDCLGPDAVIATVRELQATGLLATDATYDQLPGKLVVNLRVGDGSGGTFETHHVVFIEDGRIVEITDVPNLEAAATASRLGPFTSTDTTVKVNGLAPVFPVVDVDAALAHYQQLGFSGESYSGGAAYGYLQRDDVSIHLSGVHHLDPKSTTSAIYLYVDDARALYAQWRDANVEGRLVPPSDTDYGLCEGAHVDPDGNLIRFGSPI